MQIGTADSAPFDLNFHFTAAGNRLFQSLDADVFLFVPDCSFHCFDSLPEYASSRFYS